MTQEEFRYILQRYRAGTATPEERELVEKWYDTIGRGDFAQLSHDDEQALEKQILGHVDHYTAATATPAGRRRTLVFWRAAGIAASVLLVCSLLVAVYDGSPDTARLTTIPVRAAADVEDLITMAASTEVRRVQLTDGSIVTLQPGSTLSYDADNFGKIQREIFLQGEGFFEVAHDAQRPFYVFTGDVATRVLGTSFTIKTLGTEGQIVVAVNTGRVAVATRHSELFGLTESFQQQAVLTPNQQAVFDVSDQVLTTGLVDAPRVIHPGKTPEQMAFDDVALGEILEDLEQAYQIDIVFDAERISACFVTAKFDDESLFERLNVICRAAEAHYEVSGQQIIVYK